MSFQIDNLTELKRLLKTCGVKVTSVEEFQKLLHFVNASYDPDAARVRAGKQIASVVPAAALGLAFVTSALLIPLMVERGRGVPPAPPGMLLGGLAIIWGVAGLVALAGIAAGLWLFLTRPRRAKEAGPRGPAEDDGTDFLRAGLSASAGERSPHVTLPDRL